jgi:hypothetical protein
VGKTVTVGDMLNAGRRDARQANGLGVETSRHLVVESPKRSDAGTPSERSVEGSWPANAQPTRQPDTETTSRLVPPAATYQRQTVFFTPDQRRWLKTTTKKLPVDGLSASDVVRLALTRLRPDVEDGRRELVEVLTSQAHTEVATLAGRRNRGLPPLEGHGARGRASRGT